jgi:hypothetical protein
MIQHLLICLGFVGSLKFYTIFIQKKDNETRQKI